MAASRKGATTDRQCWQRPFPPRARLAGRRIAAYKRQAENEGDLDMTGQHFESGGRPV